MKFKLIILLCVGLSFGCKKSDVVEEEDSATEMAQNIGDSMASVDESAGDSSGDIASYHEAARKTFARLAPNDQIDSGLLANILLPKAEAISCFGYGFGGCTSGNTITRDFNGCTLGFARFTGTVTLTFSNVCGSLAQTESITRVPNFTVTGRRGATLTVTKTGTIGQRIERKADVGADKVFEFTNDGINRKFRTTELNAVIFDQTTVVSSPITVTGASRAGRVMSGGSLRVTNNLTSVSCTYVPTAVTWAAGCNCPVSGSWTGTCTNSNSSTLTITGCGTGSFTDGTFSGSVTFDRCGS